MSGGLTYYPIYSASYNRTGVSANWTTMQSSDFTDMNTQVLVPSNLRFQCITFKNISSVGAVVTWGNTALTVTGADQNNSLKVAPGETRRFETVSLGGSTGVKFLGVRVNPELASANLGTGVDLTELQIFAEFGNT